MTIETAVEADATAVDQRPEDVRWRRAAAAASGLIMAAGSLVYCGAQTEAESAPVAANKDPNIIFFLADDMDSSLLRFMPNTKKYIFERGATFDNYFTNVGLCCPARASIFTGKYAHNTGVVGNNYPDGFWGFHAGDERKDNFALWLSRSGYHTSLMGKYFNEYPFVETSPSHAIKPTYVPPGWSDWVVPVRGQYAGVDYQLNLNGKLIHRQAPKDYLGDLMARRTVAQIENNSDDSGLMTELSFYGPHVPEPASPIEKHNRDLQQQLSKIKYPRTPDFNEKDVSDKPSDIRSRHRFGQKYINRIDATYRRQILSVKSIDRYVGMVYRALKRTGQLGNTYLVFTSDNGYHMGSHRLPIGKNAPYDTDIKLPLGISGPGIAAGTHVSKLTSNIDLAPTFADMAGLKVPSSVDGESLLPLAKGQGVRTWRRFFYIQRGNVHAYAKPGQLGEPGARGAGKAELSRPGHEGVVTDRWRFFIYRNGGREFYDIKRDPYELNNLFSKPRRKWTKVHRAAYAELQAALIKLKGCQGADDCRVD